MFNVLGSGQNIDESNKFSTIVLSNLKNEIKLLKESIARYKENISVTKNKVLNYEKLKNNIGLFKQEQLDEIEKNIKETESNKLKTKEVEESINSSISKIKKLKNVPWAKEILFSMFDVEKRSIQNTLNIINRNIETYLRDKNVLEHFSNEELHSNICNLIQVENGRMEDYRRIIETNKVQLLELKDVMNLIKTKQI